MKEPKSELPWKFEDVEQISYYKKTYSRVVASNRGSWDVMNNLDYYPDPVEKEDMEYIVQACNNFPKAIELLKESKSFKRIIDYERWIKGVEEFLKSIEDGN
jgi:hypothetical protein